MDLADVAKALKDIDFVMFSSHTEGGKIASRPMSNNRDVEFDGDSWFFVDQSHLLFSDVHKNPEVTLNAEGSKACSANRRCSWRSRARRKSCSTSRSSPTNGCPS